MRRYATEDKYRPPAELRNQRRGEKAAKGRTYREADEHDHHHGGAAAPWTEFGREGDGVRHRAAETKAGQKPDREQRVDVLNEGRHQRADTESQRGENDDLLASDAIRQRSEDQRADHEPEQAGAEHRAKSAFAKAPFPGEHRGDIADGRGVETIKKQHRRAG